MGITKKFLESLKAVAREVDKEPSEVTVTEYAASDVTEKVSEWEIRKLGGFHALKKLVVPSTEKNIITEAASTLVRGYRKKVEKQYAGEVFAVNEIKSLLKEVFAKNPIKFHAPLKPAATNKAVIDRTVVVHLSDLHYGSNVSSAEMHETNEFNWTIAARRTAFLMSQVVNYKPHYRKQTELVMAINGDIIAGVIHNQEWFADLLTTQFAGALHTLGQAITYAAQNFQKVRVVCTAGNHGRAMHKSDQGRATVFKWDSYESMIYVALKQLVEAKHKNVTVVIPESPFAVINIHGHHFLQTHGDTVFTVGNVGKTLNMKAMNDQINKLNAGLLPGEDKFAAVLVGHVHTPTLQITESGCFLMVNGCLIGTDQYGQSLGIFGSFPTQTLFEVTKSHPVGDIRLISVKLADKQKDLDKIIVPFKGKL